LLLLLFFPITQQQLVLTAWHHSPKRTLNRLDNKLLTLLKCTARSKYRCEWIFP
jgi:hypothetical protein